MNFVYDVLNLVLLSVIVFQDFKYRAVSWVVFLALFLLVFITALQQNPIGYVAEQFVFNSVFILVQLVLLSIYFSIKNQKATNIINTYLGLGDILFFLILAAFFPFLNFVFVYVLSLFAIATAYLFYRIIKKNAATQIPLAGGMALSVIFLLILKNSIKNFNFYDETYLLSFLLI